MPLQSKICQAMDIIDLAADASLNLGDWEKLEVYVDKIKETKAKNVNESNQVQLGQIDEDFLTTCVLVHKRRFDEAKELIIK